MKQLKVALPITALFMVFFYQNCADIGVIALNSSSSCEQTGTCAPGGNFVSEAPTQQLVQTSSVTYPGYVDQNVVYTTDVQNIYKYELQNGQWELTKTSATGLSRTATSTIGIYQTSTNRFLSMSEDTALFCRVNSSAGSEDLQSNQDLLIYRLDSATQEWSLKQTFPSLCFRYSASQSNNFGHINDTLISYSDIENPNPVQIRKCLRKINSETYQEISCNSRFSYFWNNIGVIWGGITAILQNNTFVNVSPLQSRYQTSASGSPYWASLFVFGDSNQFVITGYNRINFNYILALNELDTNGNVTEIKSVERTLASEFEDTGATLPNFHYEAYNLRHMAFTSGKVVYTYGAQIIGFDMMSESPSTLYTLESGSFYTEGAIPNNSDCKAKNGIVACTGTFSLVILNLN